MGSTLIPPGQPLPFQPGEFTSMSQTSSVTWSLDKLHPPSELYITRDDVLVVQGVSYVGGPGDTLQVTARLLTLDRQVVTIQRVFKPIGTVQATLTIPLTEGFLLSVVVLSTVATTRGVTFCRVWLNRGTVALANAAALLVSDYVTNTVALGYPLSPLRWPDEGSGQLSVLQFTSPGAGADWGQVVAANNLWRVTSIAAQFQTSATVANRIIALQLLDGTGTLPLFWGQPNQVVPASQTVRVSFAAGQFSSVAAPNIVQVNLPPALSLPAAVQIRTVTTNIQAGDQWSNITCLMEVLLDGI